MYNYIIAVLSLTHQHDKPPTYLGTPADTTIVTAEGDALVLDDYILQVLGGLADVHALDGLSCLTGVLTQIQEKCIKLCHLNKRTPYK